MTISKIPTVISLSLTQAVTSALGRPLVSDNQGYPFSCLGKTSYAFVYIRKGNKVPAFATSWQSMSHNDFRDPENNITRSLLNESGLDKAAFDWTWGRELDSAIRALCAHATGIWAVPSVEVNVDSESGYIHAHYSMIIVGRFADGSPMTAEVFVAFGNQEHLPADVQSSIKSPATYLSVLAKTLTSKNIQVTKQ